MEVVARRRCNERGIKVHLPDPSTAEQVASGNVFRLWIPSVICRIDDQPSASVRRKQLQRWHIKLSAPYSKMQQLPCFY